MKIIATSDWHLGNLFHGNDRLPEHKHFLKWLLEQIAEQNPDALLIAGDIFDNGNPSAAAQTVYYEFLADATQLCPNHLFPFRSLRPCFLPAARFSLRFLLFPRGIG